MKSRGDQVSVWRKGIGLLALSANTTALMIPIAAFFYMLNYVYVANYVFLRMGVALPMVNPQLLILIVLALSLFGFAAGMFAPSRSRFATAFAGLVIGSLMLSIPIGIL